VVPRQVNKNWSQQIKKASFNLGGIQAAVMITSYSHGLQVQIMSIKSQVGDGTIFLHQVAIKIILTITEEEVGTLEVGAAAILM
jgi:hypothetical protein